MEKCPKNYPYFTDLWHFTETITFRYNYNTGYYGMESVMYKVIIADDEKIVRHGLSNMVDWESLGFAVEELFSDGQEVIEYLEYAMPDVILTDIKMKHVSGVDVAKYVCENHLPCKVVLISGYKEFELAVQGIKYGAEDYILKPLDIEQLEKVFKRVGKQLQQKNQQQAKVQEEQERLEKTRELLESRFFNDLVMGVVDNEEYIRSSIGVLYPNLDADQIKCMIVDISIENFSEFMQNVWKYNYDQLEDNLNNFLKIFDKGYHFHLVYKFSELIELIGIHTGAGEKETEAIVQEFVSELEQYFQFKVRWSIRYSYESLYDILRTKETNLEQDINSGHFQEKKKMIMSNLATGNVVTAQKIFHNLLGSMSYMNVANRNNVVIDILSSMNVVISEANTELGETLKTYFHYTPLLSMKRMEDVMAYCDRIFDRIKLADKKEYDTDSIINKAKAYIRENIHTDISQEEVANRLYICTSYLSRIFKKQTGESFTQYVTKVKMEKAVELLHDPQYKTYQVGEMLGYKTPRYFARLFRAHTGMNPSEYRKEVLHLGGEYDEE